MVGYRNQSLFPGYDVPSPPQRFLSQWSEEHNSFLTVFTPHPYRPPLKVHVPQGNAQRLRRAEPRLQKQGHYQEVQRILGRDREESSHLFGLQRVHHVPPRLRNYRQSLQAQPFQEVLHEQAVVMKSGLVTPFVTLAFFETPLHSVPYPSDVMIVANLRHSKISNDSYEVVDGSPIAFHSLGVGARRLYEGYESFHGVAEPIVLLRPYWRFLHLIP